MRIFIDIGHPAHVHYFRNFIKIMETRGHVIFVSARNRSIIHYLLEKYSINYYNRGAGSNSMIGKLVYLLIADIRILVKSIQFKPDLFLSFGTPYAAHVSYMLRKPHIALTDTEHAKYGILSIKRFTSTFLTPSCYYKDLGPNHIKFQGFMELCYLHPHFYIPGEDIFELLGISAKEKFVILRFITWNANHDIGQSGLDQVTKNAIIERLKSEYRIFISSEGILPEEFESYRIKIPFDRIHDVLAYAYLFIGEGATMASECAMLGTPAVYVNSLDAGTLQDQERRDLIASFRTSEGVIEKIEEWLSNRNLHKEMKLKRDKMMKEMIDPTKLLVWFIENYPLSIQIMKENPDFQMRFI